MSVTIFESSDGLLLVSTNEWNGVSLTKAQAAELHERLAALLSQAYCKSCRGYGADDDLNRCRDCNGSGKQVGGDAK